MSRRSFWAWGLEQDEPTQQQVREAPARLSQRHGVAAEPVLCLQQPEIAPVGVTSTVSSSSYSTSPLMGMTMLAVVDPAGTLTLSGLGAV